MGASELTRMVEASRARARARALDRAGVVVQGAVVVVWFGLAVGLAGLLSLLFDYGSPFVVAAVALAIGGLLAPLAITAQRAIAHELSHRRLALARAYAGEADHLPPGLRALLLETRMVHSAVEVESDPGPACRAVWEWLRHVDRLGARERDALDGLGLSTSDIREALFRDTRGQLDQVRGGLTDSQQVQVGRQLSHFEATLSSVRALPYR